MLKLKWFTLLVFLCALTSCSPKLGVSPLVGPTLQPTINSPLAEPTLSLVTPTEDAGIIQGRLKMNALPWQKSDLYIYAAPFVSNEPNGDEGFFMLEPSIHPSAQVAASGMFQIVNVSPGAYVLVIGPTPESAMALQESGHPRIVRLEANQILDLGEVSLP